MQRELSLMDAAVALLKSERKPMDIYLLFDKITEEKELSEEQKNDLITKFYSDLITSAKFVYTGENEWDLKDNQKIELWEKDGSFYKEYNVIELPEDMLEEEKPKPKPKAKPVVVEEYKEEPVVEAAPVKEEVKPEPVVEVKEEVKPEVEPVVTPDEAYDAFEDEVFDDYDDFDEDKYNEYMDSYEDQYDD